MVDSAVITPDTIPPSYHASQTRKNGCQYGKFSGRKLLGVQSYFSEFLQDCLSRELPVIIQGHGEGGGAKWRDHFL